MKKITCFETSDGKIFQTKDQALTNKAKIDFEQWYENNKLYGRYSERVDAIDVMTWLVENKSEVMSFLKSQKGE